MPGASAEVQDVLRAMAAVLTTVRGRLEEICASLPEEGQELEEEESGPSLRSLISCILTDSLDKAVRDLLRVAEEESPPPLTGPGELEGAVMSLPASRWGRELHRRLAEHERAARAVEALYAELAAVRPAERPRVLEDPRFHRAALVERLLDESQTALPEDPTRAEELARLAAIAAGHLGNAADAAQARARAACRLANARRLAGDHAGAEQALADATALSGDTGVQAELCRAVALLRWEEGRTEETAALLERAAVLWAEQEVTYEESACRVLGALLLVEEGAAKEAVALLRENLPLLADPWLTLYGGLGLALGLAGRGILEKAVAVRDEHAALVHRTPPAAHLYALRLQGEVATLLGELAAAESLFEEMRQEALAGGFLPEATVATLALARLDLLRGLGREAAKERAAALAATFSGAEGLDGVLETLRDYPDQRPEGESLRDFTAALLAHLPRLLRLHGAPSAPLPFA